MKMAGGPKQFGVDAEGVPQLLTELAMLPLEFWGFHIYSGSQNLRPEILVESQQKTAALAIELARHAPSPVRMLNLGGGFGIPYFPASSRSTWRRSAATCARWYQRSGPRFHRPRSRSNSGATWSESRACMLLRHRQEDLAATRFSSRMAGCTTIWPPPVTSAR